MAMIAIRHNLTEPVLLCQVNGVRPTYVANVDGFLDTWMRRSGNAHVQYTPQLLAWSNTSVCVNCSACIVQPCSMPEPASTAVAAALHLPATCSLLLPMQLVYKPF